jgi:hypothetical protein
MIGRTIAHYEVTSHLGKGGMGEVYRARDSRLGRDVALKVLPEGFAADAERLARFQREARLLASLNHPHIATIHGIEGDGANRVLILELVDGEDLAQRIATGALPVKEAIAIARQVADAIESAHDQGIVHRDLKPANVVVTPDGVVKVLDFGLAKAIENDASNSNLSHSPTLLGSSPTMAGVILGTAAYMSPEQARGKRVDRRADIFAFGCLLFEMLTGRQAFSGETVSDTLAAVLRAEPDWPLLPKDTPRAVVKLLKRCLEKDPRARLRDIGEARITLEAIERGVELDEPAAAVATAPACEQARVAPVDDCCDRACRRCHVVRPFAAPRRADAIITDFRAVDRASRRRVTLSSGAKSFAAHDFTRRTARRVRDQLAGRGDAVRAFAGSTQRGRAARHRRRGLSVLVARQPPDRIFRRRQAQAR